MGRTSLHELRRMGVSEEDFELARATQDAQRRSNPSASSSARCSPAAGPTLADPWTSPNVPCAAGVATIKPLSYLTSRRYKRAARNVRPEPVNSPKGSRNSARPGRLSLTSSEEGTCPSPSNIVTP